MTSATHQSSPVHIATYGRTVVRGARAAIFVHGAGMDQSVWTLQGRYLAFHGWNAMAVDLPGHGRSERRLAAIGVENLADWLGEVVESLGTRPIALIGHSMGALIALDLAARRPDLVGALCLFGAAARMPVHASLLDVAKRHDPKAVELICDWGFGPRGHVGGSPSPGGWLMGHARNLLLRGDPEVLAEDLTACNAYLAGEERAAAVHCPTLIIIGAEDRMTPPAAGQALAAIIAGARAATIERCGHMVMLESPEASLTLLSDFLDGHH
jgi:pimeloyl-ACP methyl ester carboxylesterase